MIELRAYQQTLIFKTRSLMKEGCKAILIQSPTGSGKTLLTAFMLKTCAGRGMTAFFVVHRRELVKQASHAFHEAGVAHGIVSSGWEEECRYPIQIASIQTLIRRHQRYAAPTLMIWDEAHHLGAKSWSDLARQYPDAFHVGLTATPCRLDGRGLGTYFSKLIFGPSVSWLIDHGFLSHYRLFVPPMINTDGIPTRMGDFAKQELAAVVDRPTITGDAISHYRRLADGKRAIAFCVSIEHSKHVVDQFNAAGIRAAHVDGDTTQEVRDESIERFKRGDTKILSNVDLFGEGFDVPSVEVIIGLRPTQSLGLYLQQAGRGLRPSVSKSECIIFDHGGNAFRHGLPDEDRQWTLDGISQRSQPHEGSSLRVTVCPKCFAAQLRGSLSCRFCGCLFVVHGRKIYHVEGNLQEVDPSLLRRVRGHAQIPTESLEDLYQMALRRGYRRPRAWAQHVFQTRQAKKLGRT